MKKLGKKLGSTRNTIMQFSCNCTCICWCGSGNNHSHTQGPMNDGGKDVTPSGGIGPDPWIPQIPWGPIKPPWWPW